EGTATSAVALTSTSTGATVTYTWLVTSSSGVTGFPASGTTAAIPSFTPSNPNDTVSPVVYTITPTSAGCPGSPFDYTILVKPVPTVSVAITADTI
ncbi:PKD-like domain-containing protein, partial [Klebsiella pneumoniae]|uniref:PKD-like domain-containing protein n=1 Tax=Klebsiella pneumoniae TaxID=573 RepID=UPI0038526815